MSTTTHQDDAREEHRRDYRPVGGDKHARPGPEALPDQIDHAQHADLLKKHNIDPQEFLRFDGRLGKL